MILCNCRVLPFLAFSGCNVPGLVFVLSFSPLLWLGVFFCIDIEVVLFFHTVAFLDVRSPQLNYLLTEDSIMSDLKKLHKLHKGFFSEVITLQKETVAGRKCRRN